MYELQNNCLSVCLYVCLCVCLPVSLTVYLKLITKRGYQKSDLDLSMCIHKYYLMKTQTGMTLYNSLAPHLNYIVWAEPNFFLLCTHVYCRVSRHFKYGCHRLFISMIWCSWRSQETSSNCHLVADIKHVKFNSESPSESFQRHRLQMDRLYPDLMHCKIIIVV